MDWSEFPREKRPIEQRETDFKNWLTGHTVYGSPWGEYSHGRGRKLPYLTQPRQWTPSALMRAPQMQQIPEEKDLPSPLPSRLPKAERKGVGQRGQHPGLSAICP